MIWFICACLTILSQKPPKQESLWVVCLKLVYYKLVSMPRRIGLDWFLETFHFGKITSASQTCSSHLRSVTLK